MEIQSARIAEKNTRRFALAKKKHARFSPSSTERWLECAGSVQLCSKIPERESAAAKEGGKGHKCLEHFLKNPGRPREAKYFLLKQRYPVDMVEHAFETSKHVFRTAEGRKVLSEHKADLSFIHPELWGTLDVTIAEDFGTLDVMDYKYGKWMPVEIKENSQLKTYALAEAHRHQYNFQSVRLSILQPRTQHQDGPHRPWITSIPALRSWADILSRGIERAEKKNPPFKAGAHCFFCNAKKICKAYTPDAIKSVRAGFIRAQETPEALGKKYGGYLE